MYYSTLDGEGHSWQPEAESPALALRARMSRNDRVPGTIESTMACLCQLSAVTAKIFVLPTLTSLIHGLR